MRVSVLIPSYRRSADLVRCLAALALQSRAADEVLVVVRGEDAETVSVTRDWQDRLPLHVVEVAAPGQVQALNAGLARCSGDVVAITDDDAAPHSEWLAKIVVHFEADPKVGGVGGRDWVHENGGVLSGEARRVGCFSWFGRVVGNHHLGVGAPREVDFLKGANLSFRMAAIGPVGFDVRLRGSGAQVHNDMAASLAVKCAGWKIIYDPSVAVDHFPAPRFDEDERNKFDVSAAANRNYNFRLAVGDNLPWWRRSAVHLWLRVVGVKADPGLLRVWMMLLKNDRIGLSRHRSVQNFLAEKS